MQLLALFGKRRRSAWLGLFLSALLLLPVTRIGGFPTDYSLKFSVALLAYALLTYLLLLGRKSKAEKQLILRAIALPIGLAYGYLHLTEPIGFTRVGHLSTLAHFVGIGAGWWGRRTRSRYRIGAGLTGLLMVCVFVTFWGHRYYVHWVNYGTLAGYADEALPGNMTFTDEEGIIVRGRHFIGKTVVLTCWTTSCPKCFRVFPNLEKHFEESRYKLGLAFYAVNIPSARDSLGQAFEVIRNRRFTFPVLVDDSRQLLKAFKAHPFPTMLVIRKNRIVFQGDFRMVDQVLKRLED